MPSKDVFLFQTKWEGAWWISQKFVKSKMIGLKNLEQTVNLCYPKFDLSASLSFPTLWRNRKLRLDPPPIGPHLW